MAQCSTLPLKILPRVAVPAPAAAIEYSVVLQRMRHPLELPHSSQHLLHYTECDPSCCPQLTQAQQVTSLRPANGAILE